MLLRIEGYLRAGFFLTGCEVQSAARLPKTKDIRSVPFKDKLPRHEVAVHQSCINAKAKGSTSRTVILPIFPRQEIRKHLESQ